MLKLLFSVLGSDPGRGEADGWPGGGAASCPRVPHQRPVMLHILVSRLPAVATEVLEAVEIPSG